MYSTGFGEVPGYRADRQCWWLMLKIKRCHIFNFFNRFSIRLQLFCGHLISKFVGASSASME